MPSARHRPRHPAPSPHRPGRGHPVDPSSAGPGLPWLAVIALSIASFVVQVVGAA